MSDWLNTVIENHGELCYNCGQWRTLKDREVETCSQCGDEAYDIYEVDLNRETIY